MAEPAKPVDAGFQPATPANDQGETLSTTHTSQTTTTRTTISSGPANDNVQSGNNSAPSINGAGAANDSAQPAGAASANTTSPPNTNNQSQQGTPVSSNTLPQNQAPNVPAQTSEPGNNIDKKNDAKVAAGDPDKKDIASQEDPNKSTPTQANDAKPSEATNIDPNQTPQATNTAQKAPVSTNGIQQGEGKLNPAPPAGIKPGHTVDVPQTGQPSTNERPNSSPDQGGNQRPPATNNNINNSSPSTNNSSPTIPSQADRRSEQSRKPNEQNTNENNKQKPAIGGQKKETESAGSKPSVPSPIQKSTSSDSKEPASSNEKSTLNGGGIAKKAGKKAISKAVDKIGAAAGWNAVQKNFVVNLVFLLLELISGIGTIAFIFHALILIFWVVRKKRYEQVKLMLFPFFGLVICGLIIILLQVALIFSVIACQAQQSRIPFGIPIGAVSSLASYFNPDVGNFAELCNKLNLLGAGVGSLANSPGSGGRAGGAGTAALIGNSSPQVTLVDGTSIPTEPPIITGTLLTKPQPLTPELSAQVNAAGYLSPAQCRLGDLPFSNEISLARVRLNDGRETVITLPIHQTVECIQNDPAKLTVRSMHVGKIVRLVYADGQLGDYITLEYPHNLRISYYHLTLLPELTLSKTVNAGEIIGNLGQTGQNTFQGVTVRFEYKTTAGIWQTFNPISTNPNISLLTPFPCAEDASKKCLLL